MQEISGELMRVKYSFAYPHHIPNMKHLNHTFSGNAFPCAKVRMRCPVDCVRTRQDFTDMSVIRASAHQFIDRFGEGAITQARRRADELLVVEQFSARARWQLISKEIESLNISSAN